MAGPSRLANLRTLGAANLDMAFATAFITLTTGAFLVGFAKSLGASPFIVNLLSAAPSLAGVLQIPGAIVGRGFESYRKFIAPGGAIWRAMYLLLIALPMVALADGWRLAILIAIVALGSCCVTFVNPTYNDWLAEMVPQESRGAFYSRRNAIGPIVGAIAGICGALLLDAFKHRGQQSQGFTVVFFLGSLCALVSWLFFMRMSDVPRSNVQRQSVREGLTAVRAPFGDPKFRKVLTYLGASLFAQTLPGGLFALFALEVLKLDYGVIQLSVVAYAVGILLFSRIWGFLSDQYGNKPILALCGFLIALNPIPWILCLPGKPEYNALLLISTHLIMGATWSGVNLCQFNLILATAKAEDRANYLGAGMTTMALTMGISPLLGAALLPRAPGEWAFKAVFITTIFLRILALIFLRPVEEPGSTPIRETLTRLRNLTPRGVLAMRELQRSDDATARTLAIQSVAATGNQLAGSEVVRALHDPDPRVRRQAATALASLRDPRAVKELIHQIEEHPDLVEEEVLDALGELSDPAALPALLSMMESPRSLLRRGAARATGRILAGVQPDLVPRFDDIVEALILAASAPDDPDLRRAALQALRVIGDRRAEPAFLDALLDPLPSLRIAAAEAVADLRLESAAPILRESLSKYHDEACAELAYALGSIGTEADLTRILEEAARFSSIITRRRTLLGAARILGVEREVYRLMLTHGMQRDQVILARMKGLARKHREVRVALERYANGNEGSALQLLARLDPRLEPLAELQVEESFLIAVVLIQE